VRRGTQNDPHQAFVAKI